VWLHGPVSYEAEREERLNALLQATDEWANKRRAELQRRVSVARRILLGRTGSERLARAGVRAAADRAAEALEDFLRHG
jgi:hypothetical protein